MNFKQTFTNIYNNNYNKIKRSFDNEPKSNDCSIVNTSNDENESLKRRHRQQEHITLRRQRRSSSPTRRNRQNNSPFQFSNELKSMLNSKPTLPPSPCSSSECLSSICGATTPSKKSIVLSIDTTADIVENIDNNPFITPPSSAIKINNHVVLTPVETPFQNRILIKNVQSLNIRNKHVCHPIFEVPEILNNIIGFLVASEDSNLEKRYKQRPPESYKHALLIYKDELKAKEVWSQANNQKKETPFYNYNKNGTLFNCLMVNKLWFQVTLPYLLKDLIFQDAFKFNKFIATFIDTANPKIEKLLFNRVQPTEAIINTGSKTIHCLNALVDLKIHICPKFILPANWFSSFTNLQNISITGNKVINDNYLIKVSPFLKNLVSLDLRACENITDVGVVAIALNCKKLNSINLGRHQNGEKITDISLVALGKFTQVETVGFAGSAITDNGMWEFAKWNGDNVKRLSLNNCKQLTDFSIPYLLGFNYFPSLSVLEIRYLDNLKDVKFIVKFKLWKRSQKLPLLIESCERITELMNKEERHLQRYNTRLSLMEMTTWVNETDSDDYTRL